MSENVYPTLTNPTLPITDFPTFFREVNALLDNVVYHWNSLLFDEKNREHLTAAYKEVQARIKSVQDNFVQQYEKLLEQAGLIGEQLKLKFAQLNEAWTDFTQQGSVKLLHKLFGWVEFIFGSLVNAIPILEPAREFVGLIGKLIEGEA